MTITKKAALAAMFAMLMTVPAIAQQQQQTQQTTTTTTTTTTQSPDPDINADLDNAKAMGPNNQYGDPICGAWASGVWQPNGHCPDYAVGPHRFRLEGTITAVKGHLVTVQQATRTIVIDDTPALNRQTSGRVAVGRQIVAYGYYHGDACYATVIE